MKKEAQKVGAGEWWARRVGSSIVDTERCLPVGIQEMRPPKRPLRIYLPHWIQQGGSHLGSLWVVKGVAEEGTGGSAEAVKGRRKDGVAAGTWRNARRQF